MGRRSSDSEDNSRSRRKRRQRGRSSSSSSSHSRSKPSRRRTRSRDRNRDADRRHRKRSNSSSSRGSSHRRRSRSTDRGRSHRSHRSRSRSRNRGSRSRHRRSRSRSSGRSSRKRSRSRDRDRGQRRTRDKDRPRDKTKDKETDKAKDKDKQRETGSIKAGLEHLTPAEQAKARLQLVLQAAAKTDEVLKAKESLREGQTKEEEEVSLAEQVRRIKDIEAIESDSFVPQAFKSSRTTQVTEAVEMKNEAETIKEEVSLLPSSITYNESNTLAHPNLFMDKEEAESLWLNRLISLRQERLMGSPVP
ncbi:serine/Arginine-related protein 53 [Carassius auratus]|uniref:Serine/Arginine-related protein 53 n=1 Tax=Carassius auratus TaxID=7957 RepID=A0A6P6LDK1_CARAU|nr:serine/Arginine-related protein 53 [Carassius auratus]